MRGRFVRALRVGGSTCGHEVVGENGNAAVVPLALGDLDGNADVGITDMLLLPADWGPCECPADVDHDRALSVLLLGNWG